MVSMTTIITLCIYIIQVIHTDMMYANVSLSIARVAKRITVTKHKSRIRNVVSVIAEHGELPHDERQVDGVVGM